MNNPTAPMPGLFELIGRQWMVDGGVTYTVFNRTTSCCLVALQGGGLAVISLEDEEPPHSRIRISGEDGRSTISPREKPNPDVRSVDGAPQSQAIITAYGEDGFLAGDQEGQLFKINSTGDLEQLGASASGAICGLISLPDLSLTIAASATELLYWGPEQTIERVTAPMGRELTAIALSPKGDKLATGHAGGIDIWSVEALLQSEDPGEPLNSISFEGGVRSIAWRRDGLWLVVALHKNGCQLIDLESGQTKALSGYPAPVRSVGWSSYSNAFVTSGAFRITAWSMETPPIENEKDGALQTGLSGMTPVGWIAANPENAFVAAGFDDGKAVLAKLGLRDELLVQDGTHPVTSLAWSDNGRQLVIGRENGGVSVVDFPPQMFK